MVANTEATKSQHRSLLNVDQTDSTSDDVPQRLMTKEVSEMLPEVRPKRSTLPTPIPLVRTIKAESKRFQWGRGRSEEAKFEDRQGNNVFNDYNTENMFSESVAQFDVTQLVSARAPVHDAAAGTVAPPGQTKVETLRSFSAPLCTRDGGRDPLESTSLRRQNMVDHVTHHEMEKEKRRRHLELQKLIRKQMKEKEQTRTEQEQKSISARSHCNSEVGDDPNEHGTETHREKSKVENSAKYERRRRQYHKSCETSHHGQNSRSRYRHNRPSQERRRDPCDCDSHHDDRDTDRYRDRRSSLDGRNPYYEPQQRRRHSPSVVRDRKIFFKLKQYSMRQGGKRRR